MLDRDGGLLRGTLDVLVLKSLSWGPRHGYAVAEWIRAISRDHLLVEEGPLYTSLHRLEKQRFIRGEWGYSDNNRKARFYDLTALGKQQLRSQISSWELYADAVARALAARSGDVA